MRIPVSLSAAALASLLVAPGVATAQQGAARSDSAGTATETATAAFDSAACAAMAAAMSKALASNPLSVTQGADGSLQFRMGPAAGGAADTAGRRRMARADTAAAGTTKRKVQCSHMTIKIGGGAGAP